MPTKEEYHGIIDEFKKEFTLSKEELEEVGYFVSTSKLSYSNIKKAIELGKVSKLFEFYKYCYKSPLHIPMCFDKWVNHFSQKEGDKGENNGKKENQR